MIVDLIVDLIVSMSDCYVFIFFGLQVLGLLFEEDGEEEKEEE